MLRLNRLYAQTITADFYEKNRFPAYTYDKLLLGLLDSHSYVKDPQAMAILEQTTNTALPHLPGHAVEHGVPWRADKDKNDPSWTWDESYTMPENLFLAYQRGAGRRYYDMGLQYLDDKTWFDPLSRNENVLNGRHAYSYVNSLSSAMMAYLVAGSEKHLRAGRNGFAMVQKQSFATGGWGPDETLRAPDSDDVYASLTNTHHSFETPCGSYAHFKLTRYLLRVSRDARYGDSMERMMYNTVLGAKPLEENGDAFYYSDYNFDGTRVYHKARWPCCAGTLPQVAADYRINTYFRGSQAVYVNLYLPSTLRWTENGAALSLTQEGDYPYEDRVTFTMTSSTAHRADAQLSRSRMGGGSVDLCEWDAAEGTGGAGAVCSDTARVVDRRPRRAGASAEDAAGSNRCAARGHRGAAAGTAGADGSEARGRGSGAEGDAGPAAGGEARERTPVGSELNKRSDYDAAVYLGGRAALYDVREDGLRRPLAEGALRLG